MFGAIHLVCFLKDRHFLNQTNNEVQQDPLTSDHCVSLAAVVLFNATTFTVMERLPRRKLNPHLGVEIDCSALNLGTEPLTTEGARSLFESLMTHKLVSLRHTGLTSPRQHAELVRTLQRVSLEGTDVAKKEELLYESPESEPVIAAARSKEPGATAVVAVGPFPTKKGNAIGNNMWHSDSGPRLFLLLDLIS